MPNSLRPIHLLFAALAAPVAVSSAFAAAAPTDDPAPALTATINGVIDLVMGQSADAISARVPEIRAKMNESFATEAIVQRAFGRNWTKLTKAQQTEVVDLLGRIIIRTYATQLGAGERPVVAVTSSRQIS